MLRLFTDDSGSGGDSPWSVLSGCISTVEKWAEFSEEWATTLIAPPRIKYFKMSEAESLKDNFDGLTKEQRDEKVLALARVIKCHVLYKTHILCEQAAFDRILKPVLPTKLKSPYIFSFNAMISATASYEKHLGKREPIECIFDKQQKVGTRAARIYDGVIGLPGFEACGLIRRPVRFEDDRIFLPLQAADLVAWHVRRRYCNQSEQKRPAYELLSKPPRENFTHRLRAPAMEAMAKNFLPENRQKLYKEWLREIDSDVVS